MAKILIVEDESIVALDIRNKMRRKGHEVVGVVSNGQEAIGLATKMQPDVILMDVGLKGELDGIETASLLRSQYELTIPIIYLTAFADAATKQRAETTRPSAYLNKPFDEELLYHVVNNALHHATTDASLT
ncbi:MAG: response regulator [Anaerolineae bacterium]|nr:response regulator [Anaerolineae bacterium]